MAVAEPILVQSAAKRFILKLAVSLHRQLAGASLEDRMKRLGAMRRGETVTSKHEIGGIEFYLLWKGEQRFSIKADEWSLFNNTARLELEGDEGAFTRDATMLMMATDFESFNDD